MNVKTLKLAVAVAVVTAFGVVGAQAKTGVRIGTLDCDVSGGVGLIVTSAKDMKCTLHRVSGKKEFYTGVIRKFGLDVGITGKAKMGWVVFAPGKIDRKSLVGRYVGVSADASVAVGGGANVLLGGFNKTITLQPVSGQLQTGVNVAAGVSTLVLR